MINCTIKNQDIDLKNVLQVLKVLMIKALYYIYQIVLFFVFFNLCIGSMFVGCAVGVGRSSHPPITLSKVIEAYLKFDLDIVIILSIFGVFVLVFWVCEKLGEYNKKHPLKDELHKLKK